MASSSQGQQNPAVLAGLLAVGGLGVLLLSGKSGTKPTGCQPPAAGCPTGQEWKPYPTCACVTKGLVKPPGSPSGTDVSMATPPTVHSSFQIVEPSLPAGEIQVKIGQPFTIAGLYANYNGGTGGGPGLNCYTYMQIKQVINGQWVSVYGSGVAGVFVGNPADRPPGQTQYVLVSPNQSQPDGTTGNKLTAYIAPGGAPDSAGKPGGTPVCGALPLKTQLATLYIEVYPQIDPTNGSAAINFSAPTCPPGRQPYWRWRGINKIWFID